MLDHSRWWRTPVVRATFHGRDLFAPVAAHLASGIDLADLGSSLYPATLVKLEVPAPQLRGLGLEGQIIAIDHFGNGITDLPRREFQPGQVLAVRGQRLPLAMTYADVPAGEALGLVGSHGFLEIAVNGGTAVEVLGLD